MKTCNTSLRVLNYMAVPRLLLLMLLTTSQLCLAQGLEIDPGDLGGWGNPHRSIGRPQVTTPPPAVTPTMVPTPRPPLPTATATVIPTAASHTSQQALCCACIRSYGISACRVVCNMGPTGGEGEDGPGGRAPTLSVNCGRPSTPTPTKTPTAGSGGESSPRDHITVQRPEAISPTPESEVQIDEQNSSVGGRTSEATRTSTISPRETEIADPAPSPILPKPTATPACFNMEIGGSATFTEGEYTWHKALDNASGAQGCLPVKQPYCKANPSDPNSIDSCYEVVPLRRKYGCGGIRARLSSCEKESPPIFGRKGQKMRPGLVKAR